MWEAALDYLSGRLQEPSTWNAFGMIFTGAGYALAPERWQAITVIGMIGFGAIGAGLRERKKTSAADVKSVVEATVRSDAMKPVQPSTPALEATMKAPKAPPPAG